MTDDAKNAGVFSFLEFGAIDAQGSRKEIWGFKTHQRAYDWFMLGRYANDMVAYKKMLRLLEAKKPDEAFALSSCEVHHPDDGSLNISKVLGLEVMQQALGARAPSFIELGSTIFGHIEGMEFAAALCRSSGIDLHVDLRKVRWFGVDISELLNEIGVQLHAGTHDVQAFLEREEAPAETDVFFAKGVTLLYAFTDAADFAAFIGRSRIALFDYSFSLGAPQQTTIGTGKAVTYLPYDACVREFGRSGKRLFVRAGKTRYIPETNRLWIEGIVACEDDGRAFIARDTSVRSHLAEAIPQSADARRFLQSDTADMLTWMPIEEFLERRGKGGRS